MVSLCEIWLTKRRSVVDIVGSGHWAGGCLAGELHLAAVARAVPLWHARSCRESCHPIRFGRDWPGGLALRFSARDDCFRMRGSGDLLDRGYPHYLLPTACPMPKPPKNAISPTRAENYPEWYQQVVKSADMAENLRRPWLHGDQAVGVRDMGEHPAASRQNVQGHRARERLLPAVHSDEFSREGSRARRGFRQRVRGGDPPSVGTRRRGRLATGPLSQAGRTTDRAADQRDDYRGDLRAVARVVPRFANSDQPMGQRGPLGITHTHVSAHCRVLVAGGPHGPRDRGRSPARKRGRCSMCTPILPSSTWPCQ